LSIFLSCGEPSGDHYAHILAKNLRVSGYYGDIWGMGGPRAAEAGCRVVYDMGRLCLMGILEVIPSLFSLYRLRNSLCDMIIAKRPEAVVVIDSPDFHLSLLKRIRNKGYTGRIVYLVPPTVWAWRRGRVRLLRELCDICLPLFRFEHEFLLQNKAESAWMGHPLLDEVDRSEYSTNNFRKIKSDNRVAILPGSRKSEISRLFPLFLNLAEEIEKMDLRPVFSIAPGLPESVKAEMKRKLNGKEYYEGHGIELIASTSASVAASGTVSVEAMLMDRFMAVAYRGSFISWLVYRTFVKTPFVSMPNIITGQEIYPEFLQGKAKTANLAESVRKYFEDEDYRKDVHEMLAKAREDLGKRGAGKFWAETVLELSVE